MTLIKKCDVKNYRSARSHKVLRSFRPEHKINTHPSLELKSGETVTTVNVFVEDFVLEHSGSVESLVSDAFTDTAKGEKGNRVPPPTTTTPLA